MHAVVTPWPPQRNGIADYAFELTRHAAGPVTVVTEAFDPVPLPGVARVLHPAELEGGGAERMKLLYHFGNNEDHVFAVPLFLRHPGVAVVHDATLHYLAELVDMAIPGFFDGQLEEEHGAARAAAMRRVWAVPGQKRAFDHQQAPLLRWLRDAAAVVVHSRFAARVVGALLPRLAVHVVPHFAYPPPPGVARLAAGARARFGIADDETMLVAAGFATRNKQYESILRAIAGLPAGRRVRLVIAGALRPEEFDLADLVRRLGCAERVVFAGYLDDTELAGALAGADLVLNLRHPSFGESSGSVARALGLGALVAVSDTAAYAELPDKVCVKLPARADCSGAIRALLDRLAEARGALDGHRAAAAAWAARALHPAAIARRYAAILEAADG